MATKKSKPVLKCKTVTRVEVDYHDLENFIKKVYGHDFCFVADVECSNDSDHTFTVSKEELDEWAQEKVNKFTKTGRGNYLTQVLLTDLCNKDLILPGKYLVSVCW